MCVRIYKLYMYTFMQGGIYDMRKVEEEEKEEEN